MVFLILKGIILALFLIITSIYSKVAGGFFYMLTTLTLKIPYVGVFFRFILDGPIKFGILVKILSWVISSSGLLLGIGIYYLFWGVPEQPFELYILLVCSIGVILNILHDILDFQSITSREIIEHIGENKFFRKLIGEYAYYVMTTNSQIQRTLSCLHFIDTNLPQLFRLLISIGILYFSLGNLGYFELSSDQTTLSLIDSVLLTISYVLPFEGIVLPYMGLYWTIAKIFSSICIFIWTVFYISIAVTILFEDNETPLKSPVILQKDKD